MGQNSNKVKWVGIQHISEHAIFATQPGIWETTYQGVARTQITAFLNDATGTNTIYTVPANKTLYVTSAWATVDYATTARGDMCAKTSGGTIFYSFFVLYCSTAMTQFLSQSYNMPIVVTTGGYVQLIKPTGFMSGGITGWIQ